MKASRATPWIRMEFTRWSTILFLLCLSLGTTPAQPIFRTLLNNGPGTNRINLVFLAEGYTAGTAETFFAECTNALSGDSFTPGLLNTEPLAEYRSWFNAHAIFVTSPNSGSDRPLQSQTRNTYFNSTFGATDYVISIPPNTYDATYANGRGRVDNLLTNWLPAGQYSNRFPILIVNEPFQDGGSAGTNLVTVSTGPTSLEILVHEVAHTLGGLGDEYDSGGGYLDASSFGARSNVTQQTVRSQIPWANWITATTPVPTPDTDAYSGLVGLFQGANYTATGWYRPFRNCRMRSVGFNLDFCPVCSETLVKSIYQKVRPIDFWSPTTPSLQVTNSAPLTFSAGSLSPRSHPINISWFTNGQPVLSATNRDFPFDPRSLGNGPHTLKVTVIDPTPLVRTRPEDLRITNSWSLFLNYPDLRLQKPTFPATNRISFTISGTMTGLFAIQFSTNLSSWKSLATNRLTSGVFQFTETNFPMRPTAYYRTIVPPR